MTVPEVLVVGAGPHGLTAASYLLQAEPRLAGRLAVADPRPWLAAWERHFSRLQLEVLRSACVHHPDPAPYALLHYARRHRREHELVGPAGSPSTRLFADFCGDLIARRALETARLPVTVRAVHPRSDGRVDVETNGGRLVVSSVVLAGNPARPHVPLLGARHSDAVDLDEVRDGDRVVVVGGALTAAQLAGRGAKVDLVARAPLRAQVMDVDPVWLGHTLPDFAALPAQQRAERVRTARCGTVPPSVLELLTAAPRIRVHVATVAAIDQDTAVLQDGHRFQAEHVWLATGNTFDVRADPVTARLLTEVPVTVVDGLPVLADDLSWTHAPVHVSGGLAALGVGAAARNLAGARIAAERWTERLSGTSLPVRQYPMPAAV